MEPTFRPMLKSLVRCLAGLTSIVALATNLYIFTYPSLNPQQCSWACWTNPQLSAYDQVSIWQRVPNYIVGVVKTLKKSVGTVSAVKDIHMLAFGDPQIKGIVQETPYRTRLDTFGNDFYLGHIVSIMKKRLNPSHIAVMGDQFSSQWITDSEFYNRTSRYMSRIFNKDTAQLQAIKSNNHDEEGQYQANWQSWASSFKAITSSERPWSFEFGYQDVYSWNPRNEPYLFINLTGNHDIGYSGDCTFQHLARYQEFFGKDNYWIEYDRDTDHAWRIVVLNSLLLEGPALEPDLVEATWEFLYQLFERRFVGSTVLLTHIPFYKEAGLCKDGPEFHYYPQSDDVAGGLLQSQNHLSKYISSRVLNLVFDSDRPGVILTGHDHEGCETIYNKNFTTGLWKASKTADPGSQSIREITVKSMMGQFKGNTGLLSGHFDDKSKTWLWHFSLCPFTNEHAWWVAKVSTLVAGFLWSAYILI